jgi:hypothetical protein
MVVTYYDILKFTGRFKVIATAEEMSSPASEAGTLLVS